MEMLANITSFYEDALKHGDPRVESWLLMKSPLPIALLFVFYILMVKCGPAFMENRKPVNLKFVIIPYNFLLVGLSFYMFYEFLVTAVLSKYSLKCQPVDYSSSPLALRMASVCWWFFFSKVIELLDTAFFILRKKNNQLSFLHVYHHSTMIINWWLGARYVPGGQSFMVALLNSFVHIWMYSYYGLAAVGPHMQKYLGWKRYLTSLQLLQFVAFTIHTGYNMTTDCAFPQGFNYAVFLYGLSLITLFGNFYYQQYVLKKQKSQKQM
ncbi:very long chain fatty acid elongase 7-like isoform X2 [Lineus longissimus]|uniref:very long chain fatty acid elongase 7-like isoform X2 n=1 Tax=Lineus longissimus TaxID=88925 RepID=UPI002B4F394C